MRTDTFEQSERSSAHLKLRYDDITSKINRIRLNIIKIVSMD